MRKLKAFYCLSLFLLFTGFVRSEEVIEFSSGDILKFERSADGSFVQSITYNDITINHSTVIDIVIDPKFKSSQKPDRVLLKIRDEEGFKYWWYGSQGAVESKFYLTEKVAREKRELDSDKILSSSEIKSDDIDLKSLRYFEQKIEKGKNLGVYIFDIKSEVNNKPTAHYVAHINGVPYQQGIYHYDKKASDTIKGKRKIVKSMDLSGASKLILESSLNGEKTGISLSFINDIKDLDELTGKNASIEELRALVAKHFEFIKGDNLNLSKEEILKNKDIIAIRESLLSRSAIILGDAGSGKTYTAELFAKAVLLGWIPELRHIKNIIKIDATSLSAGTELVGTFEERVKNLVELVKIEDSIVLLDELHSFRGLGTHSGSDQDFFQFIKQALADGSLKTLATDTGDEFYAAFGGDGALLRRFNIIHKIPLTELETIQAVQRIFEKRGVKPPSLGGIKEIISLSDDLGIEGAQPSRAIQYADVLINQRILRNNTKSQISLDDIRKVAVTSYNVDESFFDIKLLKKKLSLLPNSLEARVIGLENIKEDLVQRLNQRYTNLRNPELPPIRVLIPGPRGTGKTHIAKTFAQIMNFPFHRIQMEQYATKSADDLLVEIGSILRKSPFTVLLFDEWEKASPLARKAVISIMDSGKFNMQEKITPTSKATTSRTIHAHNASIIVTTNAAASNIENIFKKSYQKPQRSFMTLKESNDIKSKALSQMPKKKLEEWLIKAGFAEEVLDRFQVISPALLPTEHDFKRVLKLHVDLFLKEQKVKYQRAITLTNKQKFINMATKYGFQPGLSNREAVRMIENIVKASLSDFIIKNNKFKSSSITHTIDLELAKKSFCQISLAPVRKLIGFNRN